MQAVDETRRRTFESDWQRGSKRDISDYLPTPDDPSFLGTLEELIGIDLEFRWREVASSAPDKATDKATAKATDQADAMATTIGSWPTVEDYLRRFPELKQPQILERLLDREIRARMRTPFRPTIAEYQQRFPELAASADTLRRLMQEAEQSTHYEKPGSPKTTLDRSGNFGKYELLELLGRGGMGVVYRARQAKADRLVAIKIATIAWDDPKYRKEVSQRFESEIRAAAKLSHENVLPIYDVGEVDGATYYTMPILSGDLAAEVRKQPLTNDRAAKYLAQSARGVAAAHSAGLLHRDIKPHNLLLDQSTDRVLVSDFGLARLAVVDQSITRTGEIHGSPPYMAPEQIRDPKDIDTRSDVYALGATLYHLLVGRPPFQAATPAETMLQSLEEDPVLPRVLNRRIDRDLETICLRCLHKDRDLRFASASDLADDLDRYLRHEPIVSRPLNAWERLMRWRRRNPVVALLSGSLVAALLLVAIVSLAGWYNSERLNSRIIAGSKQGQAVLNEMFTFVRTDPILDQPVNETVRDYLLTKGLRHYEAFIALAEENDALPVDQLAARKEMGLISLDLKEPEAAEEDLRQAIDGIAKLSKEKQEELSVLKILGDAWNGLGQAQHVTRNDKEALTSLDTSIEIRKKILAKDENDFEAKRKLANSLMNHGLILASMEKVEAARTDQEAAQRMRSELEHTDGANPLLRRDLAQGEFNLAALELVNSQQEAGLARLRDATARFKKLTDEYPDDVKNWLRYVECLLMQIMFPGDTSPDADDPRPPEVIAIERLEQLASIAPKNRAYQLRLTALYQQSIELLLAAGKATIAEESWQEMRSRLFDRLDKNDQRVDAITIRLNGMRLSGEILLALGRKEEAKRELTAAIEAWRAAKEMPSGKLFRTPAWETKWAELEKLANSL